jgi:hypothetical protein
MNYVSCSPFRVPVARLAAAQAVIEEERKIMGISAPLTREKWEYKVLEDSKCDDEDDECDPFMHEGGTLTHSLTYSLTHSLTPLRRETSIHKNICS